MLVELIIDGTRIEFRKDLTLKCPNSIDEENECLPEKIEKGLFYKFDIEGYNIFHIGKAIHLFEEGVRESVASIDITKQTNFLIGGRIHTCGEYYVRVCQKHNEYKKRGVD